jgi:hypothetical protein
MSASIPVSDILHACCQFCEAPNANIHQRQQDLSQAPI